MHLRSWFSFSYCFCSYSVALMCDTEGSEIHTGELQEAIKVEVGFLIRVVE